MIYIKKVRNLPTERKAVQWDGTAETATEIIDWILSEGHTADYRCIADGACPGDVPYGHTIAIQTLEGTMHAQVGWWIIQGVIGEFYPVEHHVFDESYEILE